MLLLLLPLLHLDHASWPWPATGHWRRASVAPRQPCVCQVESPRLSSGNLQGDLHCLSTGQGGERDARPATPHMRLHGLHPATAALHRPCAAAIHWSRHRCPCGSTCSSSSSREEGTWSCSLAGNTKEGRALLQPGWLVCCHIRASTSSY